MLYLIQGEEPYLIEANLRKILKGSGEVEESDELSSEEQLYLDMQGFFGPRILVVRAESFGESAFEFVKKLDLRVNSLVLVGKIAKNTKFYKWLQKNATVIECERITEQKGPEFCARVLKRCGARITSRAAALFMERSGYYLGSINLLQVEIMLRQLSFISSEITEKEVLMLPEAEEVNRWKLVTCLRDDPKEFMTRSVQLLKTDGAIPLLSLILRAFRIGYKVRIVGMDKVSELGLSNFQFRGLRWIPEQLDNQKIEKAIDILQDGISAQKGGALSPDCAYVRTMGELVATVCGS